MKTMVMSGFFRLIICGAVIVVAALPMTALALAYLQFNDPTGELTGFIGWLMISFLAIQEVFGVGKGQKNHENPNSDKVLLTTN